MAGVVGIGRQAGAARQGEREIRRTADARRGLIADQPRELSQRVELRRGAQIALVGQTLLIEGQDVEHDGGGIEQGDA